MKRKIFEQYNNNFHPIWLPQVNCDYGYMLNGLKDAGVKYAISNENPENLLPLQNGVNTDSVDFFNQKIEKGEPVNPIFVTEDNEVLDGHHRLFAFKNNPNIDSVVCIKIFLDKSDAARVLNKIQDRYDWEKGMDADSSDAVNDPINGAVSDAVNDGEDKCGCDTNKKSYTLYRTKPIQNNSRTGNFFLTEKKPRYNHQYEIEFDNLFEMSDEECGVDPIQSLTEKWFEDIDQLKETAIKNALTYEMYINRKIVDEAKKRGYDGIKYGNKFIQAI